MKACPIKGKNLTRTNLTCELDERRNKNEEDNRASTSDVAVSGGSREGDYGWQKTLLRWYIFEVFPRMREHYAN